MIDPELIKLAKQMTDGATLADSAVHEMAANPNGLNHNSIYPNIIRCLSLPPAVETIAPSIAPWRLSRPMNWQR